MNKHSFTETPALPLHQLGDRRWRRAQAARRHCGPAGKAEQARDRNSKHDIADGEP